MLGKIEGWRCHAKSRRLVKDISKILGDDKDDNKTLKRHLATLKHWKDVEHH
jgi:hypothetical protein